MRPVWVIATLAALAGCGVDGEPVAPAFNAGVGLGTQGVSASGSVGIRKGPFSIGWGMGL